MVVFEIVVWQFSLGALMIVWRYGVVGVCLYSISKCLWCIVKQVVWMTWKFLLWAVWLVAFCGCCCRCSLDSAQYAAARCVERVQDIVSSIFLKNTCWELECNFKLPKKIQQSLAKSKEWMNQKQKQAKKSPLVIAMRPQWYWLHLTAQVGFLWREFIVITMNNGWYWVVALAYGGMALVVFFTAQQVWKFSKVRNFSPDARNAIDQVLDMLLLPINYGFLCALTVRTLRMDAGEHGVPNDATTKMAIAVVDSADIWESWALWSVLQLFIRVVDVSAKEKVGATQDSKPLSAQDDNADTLEVEPVVAKPTSEGTVLLLLPDEEPDHADQPVPAHRTISAVPEQNRSFSSNNSEQPVSGEGPNPNDVPRARLVPSPVQPHSVQGGTDEEELEIGAEAESQGDSTDEDLRISQKRSISHFVVENLNIGSKYLDVVASFKYLSNYGVQCWVYILVAASLLELVVKGFVSPHFPTTCFKLFKSCDRSCDAYYDDEIAPSVYVVEYILCCAAIAFVLAFERTFKEYLHGIDPYWKFWGVKIVVSVTFAQKIVINHCCGFEEWQVYLYHCVIICLELPMLCGVHTSLSYPYNRDWMFQLMRSDTGNKPKSFRSGAEEEQAAVEGADQDGRQQSAAASHPEESIASAFETRDMQAMGRHYNRKGRGRSPHRKFLAGRGSSCSPNASSSSQASNISIASRQSPHVRRFHPSLRRHKTNEGGRPSNRVPNLGRSFSETRSSSRTMSMRMASNLDRGTIGTVPSIRTDDETVPADTGSSEAPKEFSGNENTDGENAADPSKPTPDDERVADTCGCCGEDDEDEDLDEDDAARKAANQVERLWVFNLYIALGFFWCFVGIGIVQRILPYGENTLHSPSPTPTTISPVEGTSCSELPSDYIKQHPNASLRLPDAYSNTGKISICQHITLGCAQGFQPQNKGAPPVMTCTAGSKYDVKGICESTKCGAPVTIENAHPRASQKECCVPGQEVDYACNPGFVGSARAICQLDAHWKVLENNCQIVGCGSLESQLKDVKTYVHNGVMFPTAPFTHDSFDGQVVSFTCAPGLRGDPKAICYARHWHLTDSGNVGGEPCAKFVTAHGCHCKPTWRHCTGRFFTDCYEYHGCARSADKEFAWCRVDRASCQELLGERDFFGQSKDWDYCVDDNFGITWNKTGYQPGRSYKEGMRTLTPQFFFGLAVVLGFCLTFYLPVWAFGVIVTCVPRVPGWRKLCYTFMSRPPRAIRRIWLTVYYKAQVDTALCRKWSSERWTTFVQWFLQQIQEWRQWYEGDTGGVHPTTSQSPESPDAAKLSTGWPSVPPWLQWGFLKTSIAEEPIEEANPANITEAAEDAKSLTAPLLRDDHS